MKFTTVLAVLAGATAVYAQPSETNGERLARGLPPLPPVRRATHVAGEFSSRTMALIIHSDRRDAAARRSKPSGTPDSGIHNSCNTGPVQCCASTFFSFS